MTAGAPRIGILLPTRGILLDGAEKPDAALVLSLAEAAEEAGCDSVWVGDSLTAKPRLEPLTTLAAVGARTKRVRLGTAVLLAALRHPLLLAQVVHSLDHLSRGRLVLGVGVGGTFTEGMRQEWAVAGVNPAQRAGRLEETVSLLRQFRSEPRTTFHGLHFQLEGVAMEPRPVQKPGVPIWLACHYRTGSQRQYRRAALLGDGLLSITDSPEEYAHVVRQVRAYAREAGREDADKLEAAFYMTVNLNDNESEAQGEAEAFLLRYYGTKHWGNAWGPFGKAERVTQRIREYMAAGAQTVILRFASFDQHAQLERLRQEVLPRLA